MYAKHILYQFELYSPLKNLYINDLHKKSFYIINYKFLFNTKIDIMFANFSIAFFIFFNSKFFNFNTKRYKKSNIYIIKDTK